MANYRDVINVYWRHVSRYRWMFFFTVGLFAVLQGALLATPWFLRRFFDILVAGNTSAATVHALIGTLGLIALMWAISWVCRRLIGFVSARTDAQVMADLYDTEFAYLLQHSHNFFISRFAGSLTHKVSKLVKSYQSIMDDILGEFFPTFLFVLGAIVVLYFRNHTLGLALAGWTVAFFAFQIWVARLRQPIRAARADGETRITATVADAIGNHATIALFSGAVHERNLLAKVVEAWRRILVHSWDVDEYIWGAIGLFTVTIQIGLLWGAIGFWQKGLLTIGDFVLIQTYLIATFDRLVTINRALRRFFDAFADAAEMVEILKTPHGIKDAPGAQLLTVPEGAITFKDVDFYFNETRPVLKRFNLSIVSDEKVALVGSSGAGKTTITKLILRLYDVTGGTILIDGQDIAHVTQESLRNAIAFVPQEPTLFHRSLMDNIRYGRRDATDEEVIEAAKQAHCHEFISTLPQGYGTFVGERGVKLSGGERQRVAIARAILKNAPILVLDEATSSLDSESESLIQDALKTLMKGKTVIVIAHRLSTIMSVDRIVVIDGGSIVAEGTHEKLLAEGGLYQKLWSIQAGGFMGADETLDTKL